MPRTAESCNKCRKAGKHVKPCVYAQKPTPEPELPEAPNVGAVPVDPWEDWQHDIHADEAPFLSDEDDYDRRADESWRLWR